MRHHRPAPRRCQNHCRANPGSQPLSTQAESTVSMFLPPDLTTAEQELVATVTKQLLAHRSPSTPAEEQAVRHEAAQVAAEMIWEARGQQQMEDLEEEGLGEELAKSPYHQRLARVRAENLAIQEAEDEDADRPL